MAGYIKVNVDKFPVKALNMQINKDIWYDFKVKCKMKNIPLNVVIEIFMNQYAKGRYYLEKNDILKWKEENYETETLNSTFNKEIYNRFKSVVKANGYFVKHVVSAFVEDYVKNNYDIEFVKRIEQLQPQTSEADPYTEIATVTHAEVKYIWYACYGVDMSSAWFMKYISNCKDKTPPMEERKFFIPYSLYFAGTSKLWSGKAVAYIDANTLGITMGKIYKITEKQFEKIKSQMGASYSKTVDLGEVDNIKVYTLTNSHRRVSKIPTLAYLKVILDAKTELHPEYSINQHGANLADSMLNELELQVIEILCQNSYIASLKTIIESANDNQPKIKKALQNLINLGIIEKDIDSGQYGVYGERIKFSVIDRKWADQVLIWKKTAEIENLGCNK